MRWSLRSLSMHLPRQHRPQASRAVPRHKAPRYKPFLFLNIAVRKVVRHPAGMYSVLLRNFSRLSGIFEHFFASKLRHCGRVSCEIPEFQGTVFRYGRVLNFLHGNLRFDANGVRTSILRYFYDRARFCELLLEMPANFAYLR